MGIVTKENPKTGKLERVFVNDISQKGPADYLATYEEKKLENRLLTLGRSNNFRLQLSTIFKPGKLFFVNITNYFPKNGIIRTHGFVSRKRSDPVFRETIHFTINGGVGGHSLGNWDGSKYAIIVPWEKIIDRIICLNIVDSFTFGNLTLPKGSVIIYDDITHPRYKKLKYYTGIPGVKCLSSKDLISESGKDLEKTNSIIHQAIDSFMNKKNTHCVNIGAYGSSSSYKLVEECFKDPQELADPDFLKKAAIEFYTNCSGNNKRVKTIGELMKVMAKSMQKMSSYHNSTWFYHLEKLMLRVNNKLIKRSNTSDSEIINLEEALRSLKELKKKGKTVVILESRKENITIAKSSEEIKAINSCINKLEVLLLGIKKSIHTNNGLNLRAEKANKELKLARKNEEYLMREFKIIQDINISIPPPLPGSKNFSIKNETWDLIQKKFKELKRIENKMWRLSKKLYDMAYHDLGNQVKGTVDELDILNSNLLVGVNILKNKIRDGIEFNNVENVLKFMGDMEEIIKGEIIKLKDFENFLNHMVKVRDNSFQKAA